MHSATTTVTQLHCYTGCLRCDNASILNINTLYLLIVTKKPCLLQVICWFQNRRAKFKRDMEELKKDVEKTSQAGPGQPGHSPGPRPPPPPALGPGHPALPPGLRGTTLLPPLFG